MTVAAEDSDDVRDVREFFASITPGERKRLYELFMWMMGKPEKIQEGDWRDYEPDGNRRAPKIRAATNGK